MNPVVPEFALGYKFSSLAELGFQRVDSTIPPANGRRVSGSTGRAESASPEKSPFRCARLGTVQVFVAPWRRRLKSSPRKKNSLLLFFLTNPGIHTGPPTFQPKLLNLSSG